MSPRTTNTLRGNLTSSAPALLHTVFTITAAGEEYDTEYDATTDEDAARNHPWLTDQSHLIDPTCVVTVRRVDVFSDGTATNELFIRSYAKYSHEKREREYWLTTGDLFHQFVPNR